MRDIAIIGGGINGCGVARDAAGRGLAVLLAEKGDLASGTSSASTKLIHGGLRYLEHYEFALVRSSLKEREVLLGLAPHIVRPMRFVLPHHRGLRPAFLIRLGLFLYDHLGGGRRMLERSRALDLSRDAAGQPLKPTFRRAFEYSDCWVDDARLVVLNAMDAAARGAEIRVRTEVVSVQRTPSHWRLELKNLMSGQHETVTARVLINAAGAWAATGAAEGIGQGRRSGIRLVKGSHIVVRRLFEHDRAYIFQNADRRIVFAIPYEGEFTLIGTTDVDFANDLGAVAISPEEAHYLCRSVSEYFAAPVSPSDIVWSYAGVRSLYDDGQRSAQDATRDFVLDLDAGAGQPWLLTIIGGKITTYRHLAEEVLAKLAPLFPRARAAWTRNVPLPGGDFAPEDLGRLASDLAAAVPALSEATSHRLVRSYGTMAREIFADRSAPPTNVAPNAPGNAPGNSAGNANGNVHGSVHGLGFDFGAGLYEREVAHLVKNEWAMTAEDVLWRRTKLGLHIGDIGRRQLSDWLLARLPASRQLRQTRSAQDPSTDNRCNG
jgi:glycerol-3-phosphate dehydrogenase